MDTNQNPSRHTLLGSAFVLLGAIAFSAKAILIKLAYADSVQPDAITLMTLRMLMALPFFSELPCGIARLGERVVARETTGSPC